VGRWLDGCEVGGVVGVDVVGLCVVGLFDAIKFVIVGGKEFVRRIPPPQHKKIKSLRIIASSFIIGRL